MHLPAPPTARSAVRLHSSGVPLRKYLALTFALLLVLAACKSSSDGASPDDTGSTTTDTRAPGVTSDAIKVGVTFVDLSSLKDILNIDLGDYEGAYQALFDDINANGGINGRMIEATYAPASPVGTEATAAACTKLTQDDPSFVVLGGPIGDSALCYVDTQQTALIGGTMTAEGLAQAKAPWYSTWASDDLATDTTQKMLDEGLLDGSFAVVGRADEKASIEATTLKVLQDAGKEPAETAYVTSPSGDATALNAEIATIAERLKSEGVDTVVLAGDTIGNQWLTGAVKTSYRPTLLFMQTSGIDAFAITPGNDLSILDGVIGGGVYPAAEGAGTRPPPRPRSASPSRRRPGSSSRIRRL